MTRALLRVMLAATLVLVASSPVFAQGGNQTSAIGGIVADAGGGAIPGATVVVKNNATNATYRTVTNSSGAFSVPALEPGQYTVTVSLQGFKQAIVNDLRLLAATPADLKVTLEVGAFTDQIVVQGGNELIQTQSPTIASTIGMDQIANLPLVSRNALNFITFLPGVDTPGVNRDSEVSGLPQSTLNITLDGVNAQDNFNKTGDGFFARVNPRLDAVEQVTVTTATQGADSAGQGAVQIRFVTRSGTNQYTGSVYHYFRHPSLNTNYYFNELNHLDKNDITINQFGAREGGPIAIPGLYDGRGKAFFFVNYEEFRTPTEVSRTRTMFNPRTETGIFRYNTAAGVQEVNLFDVATRNGQIATPDPTIAALVAQIRAASGQTGTITQLADPNLMQYFYQAPSHSLNRYPSIKIDYNLTQAHRLSGTYNSTRINSNPDILNGREPNYPGLPNTGAQISNRHLGQVTLRSTVSANMVNELRFGGAWGPTQFSPQVGPGQFENQGGFSLGFPLGVTGATDTAGNSTRQAANWTFDNTLSWQRGNHSFSFGGGYTRYPLWITNQTHVPSIGFGVNDADPANPMFNTTEFPGSSQANRDNAEALYAFLTGRVVSINGISQLDEANNRYNYLGARTQRARMDEMGIFAQDSWRWKPNLTLNFGLRYELQWPFVTLNDVISMVSLESFCGQSGLGSGPGGRQCNLFKPGTIAGSPTVFTQYDNGLPGYSTDYNNFAPNIGVAWRPNVESGWLRTILGDPDQATVRGGFSVAYNRNGMGDFTGVYGDNPGSQITTNRTVNNGNLLPPGHGFPLLFSEKALLGPPPNCAPGAPTPGCVPETATYPIPASNLPDVAMFDPDLEVSYSRSWSIGLQRSINRNTAVEFRYIGTRNHQGWTEEDWNEPATLENGFYDEFKLAQQNLYANMAAGRGNTFAYFGPNTGTNPLPIYLAYFNGLPKEAAVSAGSYTGNNWTNGTFVGRLAKWNPNPNSAASDLFDNAGRRTNSLNAGLSTNFFLMNPDVDEANMTRSLSGTKYHSFQVDLRRRLSRGFLVNANYTYGRRWGTANDTLRKERFFVESTAGVAHAVKMSWVYEIPVGSGKRYGTDMNKWLNGVLGGWEFDGTGRVQTGRRLTLTGVRLVGMTQADLQKEFYIRFTDTVDAEGRPTKTVWTLPEDIILNTRRAFGTSATSETGYGALGVPEGRYIAPQSTPDCIALEPGDCSPRNVFITGPMFTRFDVSFKKKFPFARRASFNLEINVLNVFDNINFIPVLEAGTADDINRVETAYTDISNTNDPGGRLGQIVWRIIW